MFIDFLAQPNMTFELGGRKFVADADGIIADVPAGNFGGLLAMGAIPLTPHNWVDPRRTATVSPDGKVVTVS
jgi:hypothetical protein